MSKIKEAFLVIVCLAAVAVFFTWPLARHMGEAIPQASAPSAAVPYYQLFSCQWTGSVLQGGGEYWNAPFFYPFSGAFAWSEPQFANCAFIALLARACGYVTAYNLYLWLLMVLMGLAGYSASRLLTSDRMAAFFAAAWLCAGAFSLQQLCAPALLAAGYPFFFIIFAFLYARSPKAVNFTCAVFFYCATWFTCKQTAFTLTLLIPFLLYPWINRGNIWKGILACLAGLCVTALFVLPSGLQQLALTLSMAFGRRPDEVRQFLSLAQLFTPASGHWLASGILKVRSYSWDLGIVPLVVIVCALIKGIRVRQGDQQKRIVLGLTISALAALGMGFAPVYAVLFRWLPGFTYIRVPQRSAVFAIFGIAVISAFCLGFLRNRLKPRARGLFTGLAFVFLFAEMWALPVNLVYPDKEISSHQAACDWLKSHGSAGPVLELPLTRENRNMDASAMLRMLYHRHPLINGYNSFSPDPYLQLSLALHDDPGGRGVRFCRAIGARFVLLHKRMLSSQDLGILLSGFGQAVFEDAEDIICALPPVTSGADNLPRTADFRLAMPAKGKTYSLRLSAPLAEARLFFFYPPENLRIKRQTAAGAIIEQQMELRGAVLLDRGQDLLYFRVLAVSDDARKAVQAKLAASEEAGK